MAGLAVAAAAATTVVAAAPADATPVSQLRLGGYSAVNATAYRSLSYQDNGRVYFRAGRYLCQMGPQPGSVACKGYTRTAPTGWPGVQGVAITQDQQGPWWVPNNPWSDFKIGPRSHFRVPALPVGKRISVYGATCARMNAGTVGCATTNRGFVLNRAGHKFYVPRGDNRHAGRS
ncbi:MAG: hypothetical protein QM774_11685 [Gordonia sp. (in: high G+C Gram-positive bacteria)]|uniref:hypothetical protein n=1 Tax=Gordonia sp. (in: high G+C Gram-positive bacteria) TaxID=84139 RepID=UPI0039E3FD45